MFVYAVLSASDPLNNEEESLLGRMVELISTLGGRWVKSAQPEICFKIFSLPFATPHWVFSNQEIEERKLEFLNILLSCPVLKMEPLEESSPIID